MKCMFIFILSAWLLPASFAQVSGKLTNHKNQPIPFANLVLLRDPDSSFVTGGLSDEYGQYKIENINPGKYFLRVSSTGYETWHSPLFEIGDLQRSRDFGVTIMTENSRELDEVILRSEKPIYQQKPAGIVVNVENSLLTKGSSALQVLERSPGVVINRRDNSIELNGKSGVLVMLNGKLMRMPVEQVVGLLNGMSADEISKIELLTTPPASYDAEGSAGIINIVLKKNKRPGTTGTVSVTGGYGYGEKSTGSLTFSHNNSKTSLYGSYTFGHNRTYSDMSVESFQRMPFLGGDVHATGWFTTRVIRNNHDAVLGVDLKLNDKTTIGGNISYNGSKSGSTNLTDAGFLVLPDSLLQFTGDNRGITVWRNFINSIYFEKTTRQNGKITFDLDYLRFTNDGRSDVQSSFVNKHGMQAGTDEILFSPAQKGLAHTTIQVGVGKMDYSKQLAKSIKLETGIKTAYTQSRSISGIQSLLNSTWTSHDQTSNDILMKESVGAMYVSVNTQVNQSLTLLAGLRYEYSFTKMDHSKTGENIVRRKLGALFPVLFLTRKINEQSELQLSFTKRITRPSYNDLASYVGYSDPTAVYTGNPFLKPTLTHNVRLGYNYKSYSVSLLFSRDKDAITRYQLTESPGKDMLYISPQNLPWMQSMTLQATVPVKINAWWQMNYSFAGGHRQYKADYVKLPFEKTWFGYSFNFSQAFTLPRNFSAELSGFYHSTSYDGTRRVEGFGVLNAGFKKDLAKNRGSLQLSITDILGKEQYKIRYGTLTEEAFSIQSHVRFYTESAKFPIVKLSYSRSFGKNRTGSPKKTATGEEQDRIRKD